MAQIDIPFNDWSSERHQTHDKRATTRTSKYGEAGDTFVDEDAGMRFQITHIFKLPLEIVRDYFWQIEGANSNTEFQEVWEDIHHKKGFEPEWEVYTHLYIEVE